MLQALGASLGDVARAPSSFEAEHSGLFTVLLRYLTDVGDDTLRPRIERVRLFAKTVGSHVGALAALVEALQGSLSASPSFTVKEHRDRSREVSSLSAPIKVGLSTA